MKPKIKSLAISVLSITLTVSTAAPAFAHPLRMPQSLESDIAAAQKSAPAKNRKQKISELKQDIKKTEDELKQVGLILKHSESKKVVIAGSTIAIGLVGLFVGGSYASGDQAREDLSNYTRKQADLSEEITQKIRSIAAPGVEFKRPVYGTLFRGDMINWDKVSPSARKQVIEYVESVAAKVNELDFAKTVAYARSTSAFNELPHVNTAAVSRTDEVLAKADAQLEKVLAKKSKIGMGIMSAGFAGLAIGTGTFFSLTDENQMTQERIVQLNDMIDRGQFDQAKELSQKYQLEAMSLSEKLVALNAELDMLEKH